MFAPELTYSTHGIVVRRKKGTDLNILTQELHKLYPKLGSKWGGKDGVEKLGKKGMIISRENLNSLPELKSSYGYGE